MNALKTILYMGCMHGFLTFYLPYQIGTHSERLLDFGTLGIVAVFLWILGTLIIIICSIDMVRRGRGTPAHLDPPKYLIVTGLYRHVRNPIYLGALLVQLGYLFWFGSALLILYLLFYILAFHLLIVLIEEPILKNMFGHAYDEYCNRVPRWFPKLR